MASLRLMAPLLETFELHINAVLLGEVCNNQSSLKFLSLIFPAPAVRCGHELHARLCSDERQEPYSQGNIFSTL